MLFLPSVIIMHKRGNGNGNPENKGWGRGGGHEVGEEERAGSGIPKVVGTGRN